MSLRTTLLTASALTALIAAPVMAQSATTSDTTTEVIVTGSRGKPRTVTSSPAPIDIIGADQIGKLAGSMPLRDVLTQLVPSYQSMSVGSSSQDSIVRPAGLRGMSGVHVLVLVNGQRRHNSSLINLNSGNVSAGANPVDIDLIPASAIDHIEILRDGAAAQYGSDAIAGVINIILKSNKSGSAGSVEVGQRFEGDGTTISVQASQGFALPHDGSTTVSLALKSADKVVRNSDVTGTFYDTIGGKPDPREASANRRTYQGGLPEVHSLDLVTNTILPLNDNAQLYAVTTVTTRDGRAGQAGRKPNANSNITAIYPNGFTPYYTMKEYDFQVSTGVKGTFKGWDSNLGTTFGRDHVINGADSSINASLGAASPTRFETYSSQFDQWTTNLDLTRHFDVFGGKALQVSTGAEFRHENYQTHALDKAAYVNGGYYYTSGTNAGKPALTGAQGAIIVLPSDEADISRNVTAAYVDLALDVTPKWLVTAAARFETYDDSAGDVVSGKISTRYKVTDWLTVRGAASTGFRAPSLAQMGYAQTGTQFNLVGTTYQLIESKIVKTDSPVGVALGAQPLKPEKSRNYSGGFALTPGHGFTLTLDAYQIELDDRIQLTGLLSSAGVKTILIANGFSGNQYVRYFANAIDTTTKGVDLVATYTLATARFGTLRTTLGYNHNETEIRHIADTPAALAGLGLTLFDRQTQGYITELQPKDKVILGADWTAGAYAVSIKETRYGEFNLLGATSATDQKFGAKYITDLELSRKFGDGYRFAIGAYNLLDVYPDKNTIANTIGSSPYAAYSPFGGYGGYYYARLSWKK
ncbi:TonB-dependent receptor [Asticcacaulis sp. 201]|uniref:TonB-dependent receptor plug domain-containing protein n=1 Tax=Asticcacaulis sp. 201 TaxID=3028787 RepID=UPI0029166FDD|nr:TonB-dependent receptor [Asticcacaulis sp. 201]MDV6330842.1 TonB-dependent receptor [Asticcacaulis sp. 201]